MVALAVFWLAISYILNLVNGQGGSIVLADIVRKIIPMRPRQELATLLASMVVKYKWLRFIFYYSLYGIKFKEKVKVLSGGNCAVSFDGRNLRMQTDSIYAFLEIFREGIYEKEVRIKQGDVVLDVGAHVGLFTLRASREVGNDGVVIAIEPASNNLKLLHRNINEYKMKNVRVVEKAAWDRQTELSLFLSRSGACNSVLYKHKNSEKVQADSLDNMVSVLGIEHVDFIKIDAEGAELEILRGSERLLDTPSIKLAVASYHDLPGGVSEMSLVSEYLKSHGFRIQRYKGYVYASKIPKLDEVVGLKVSVVIPTFTMDRLDDIKKVVQSVLAQTYAPSEIILSVDHNEELFETLKAMKVDHIKVVLNKEVIGGAETRNVGIYSASGDVVAFTDDDAVADKNWLRYLVAQYGDPDVMAIGGRTISVWEKIRPRWFPEELDWIVGGTWKGHPDKVCEVRNLIGPNMSFRRLVCDKIGYMRSELGALGHGFRAGDETEFYIRMKHYIPDGKIMFEPKAIIYHTVYQYKTTLRQLCVRSYGLGFYKSKMSSILLESTKSPFKVEQVFLRYLLFESIPRKLRTCQIKQALAIGISIICCGIGFVIGRRKSTTVS